MSTILLLIELFVTLALIGIVLIQRSEGGGLGIGGSQGMGSFMTGRGTANLLTRTTAILAVIFMVLAIAIGLLNRGQTGSSILNVPPPAQHAGAAVAAAKPSAPGAVPGAVLGAVPSQPQTPTKAPSAEAPALTARAVPTGPSVPTQGP